MSILNVEHLSHGFGDRAIFQDVSFRLLKGEHIGLVGANGEGKSTFMNIITGKLMPDEGKIEWSKNVQVGYLDQHTALEKGQTVRDVLASAFDSLYTWEARMNEICELLGTADENEMETYMEELGTIQDLLTAHDFYLIDSKVEEVANALGLTEIGIDRDVTELSGGQRTKVLLGKLLLSKPDILLLDEPTNYLDVVHIEWLKRYLIDYENAFILISHDIPFINEVVNLIYHMDHQELNRYVGNYDKFMEVYEMKQAQLEAAYNKQQKEIADLKDFVARNKARVATRNMAMSRQKKLDKMDLIELNAERPKPEFHFKTARTPGRYIFQTKAPQPIKLPASSPPNPVQPNVTPTINPPSIAAQPPIFMPTPVPRVSPPSGTNLMYTVSPSLAVTEKSVTGRSLIITRQPVSTVFVQSIFSIIWAMLWLSHSHSCLSWLNRFSCATIFTDTIPPHNLSRKAAAVQSFCHNTYSGS